MLREFLENEIKRHSEFIRDTGETIKQRRESAQAAVIESEQEAHLAEVSQLTASHKRATDNLAKLLEKQSQLKARQ